MNIFDYFSSEDSDALIRIYSIKKLQELPCYSGRCDAIRNLMSLPDEHFDALVDPILYRFAEWVQSNPASEYDHHAGEWGMLEHTLDTVINVLKLRRGYLLPQGVGSEEINKRADIWTYAMLLGGIFHDLMKVAVDQSVVLYDKRKRKLGPWDVWKGPMTTVYAGKAWWYELGYRSERNYQLHERLGLMLFTQLVPAQGVSWLFSDPKATDDLTNLLTGHIEDSGIIGDLVKQADMASAASSKGGNVARLSQRQRPLYQHMLNTLRMMIDNGQVPLNRKGGAGFLVDDDLWLMGSRVAEMIKEQLVSEGVSVPQNNSRLFDTLQEVNFIIPNEDHALWYVNLEIGDWKPTNDFSMLRMPISILGANIVDQLTQFDGKLSIVNRQSVDSDNTQPGNIEAEDSPKNELSDTNNQPSTDTPTLKRKKKHVSPDESGTENPPITLDVGQENLADSKTDKVATDLDATINHAQGTAFIDWTKESLMNGTLKYNLIDAKVHVVNEGVLLVSPAIFKLFAAENPLVGKWDNIQRNFQRMGINIKERTKGENVHHYITCGSNKSSTLKGFLVPKDAIFDNPDDCPAVNSILRVKTLTSDKK